MQTRENCKVRKQLFPVTCSVIEGEEVPDCNILFKRVIRLHVSFARHPEIKIKVAQKQVLL